MMDKAAYLFLNDKDWETKTGIALSMLADCTCCPRFCHVNRKKGEKGICGAGAEPVVAAADAHFGEEPPISGYNGSGTIFFTFCTMKCVYCQNYPFSQLGQRREKSIEELASIMVYLQDKGCHNINLVTPTHFAPQILLAVKKGKEKGLKIPIVYNTSSYDSMETLSLMEGIVDIYLADMRYDNAEMSARYSGTKDYPEKSRMAIKEMFRQVGRFKTGEEGVGIRGLIIRHLVLPDNIAGSRGIFEFIAHEVSQEISISLMSQYFPTHKASLYPELNRRITPQEYQEALTLLEEYGLTEGWRQDI